MVRGGGGRVFGEISWIHVYHHYYVNRQCHRLFEEVGIKF